LLSSTSTGTSFNLSRPLTAQPTTRKKRIEKEKIIDLDNTDDGFEQITYVDSRAATVITVTVTVCRNYGGSSYGYGYGHREKTVTKP